MSFNRLTDFNRTSQRRLDSVAKNQCHPVPCGNPDQHAVRVGRTKLRSVSYDFIECLQSLPLLSDQKLGIANDVDQQNVPNFKLQFRLRVSGHITLVQQRTVSGSHPLFLFGTNHLLH